MVSVLDFRQLKLETERMVLKVLDENSASLVLDYYKQNKEFLEEWEPLRGPEFYTLDNQREALRKEFIKIVDGSAFRVWLFKKEDALSRIIGSIGLNNIVYGAFQSCHLGYKLDISEINQGLMTEALMKIIDFAFTTLRLHRIEANILPRNTRSINVVKKLNFYDEGLAKKYLNINGQWEDHIHMVLLNDALE